MIVTVLSRCDSEIVLRVEICEMDVVKVFVEISKTSLKEKTPVTDKKETWRIVWGHWDSIPQDVPDIG